MRKDIRIGFYTCESIDHSVFETMKDCDAALLSVKDLSNVKIKSELDGKSDNLLRMGVLSKKIKGVCFFSVYTDTYGVMRNSIACFSSGRILALADLNGSYQREISPAFGFKSVRTGGVRYGVLVGSDILDPSALHALSVTENDVIINLSPNVFDFDNEKLITSLAFLYGVPIASVGNNKKVFSKACGEPVYSGNDPFAIAVLPIEKKYRETRKKILRS